MYIAHVSHNINFFKLATWFANPDLVFSLQGGLYQLNAWQPEVSSIVNKQEASRSYLHISPYYIRHMQCHSSIRLFPRCLPLHQAARSVWPMLLFLAGLCWDPSRSCLHVSAALHDLRLSQHWSILRSCINLALIRVSGRWKCMASMYINVNVIIQHTDVHLNLSQGGLIGILGRLADYGLNMRSLGRNLATRIHFPGSELYKI